MAIAEGLIFDLDGTLYPATDDLPFYESNFGKIIYANTISFFQNQLGLDEDEATDRYRVLRASPGPLGKAIEEAYGLPREQYYNSVWDIAPDSYVTPQPGLRDALVPLVVTRTILSGAPSIWVGRVLDLLGVADQFDSRRFTGELVNKKPQVEAFSDISDYFQVEPSRLVSIGDQEHTDIVPARRLGMITVLIATQDTASKADFIARDAIEAIDILKNAAVI